MNYHEARQTADKSGWDWTTMNDGQIWRSGACADHGPGGHATREQAERHFYDGELANLREIEWHETQHPCAVCKAWTSKALETRLSGPVDLCDEHRNAAGFEQASPFAPGRSIVASW